MSKARDIADLDFNSPDIDGGNIDGAVIGATTAAAGDFTSVGVAGVGANPASSAHAPAIITSGSYGGGLATVDTNESGWYQISNGANWVFYHNKGSSDSPSSKNVLEFNSSGNATFAGTVEVGGTLYIPQWIEHSGDSNTYFGFVAGDEFKIVTGNTGRLHIKGAETVFNEGGEDKNFRVESNNNENMFIVDGGSDTVRIGHIVGSQTPATLHIRKNGSNLEFGHNNNTAGYFGTLGAYGNNGHPYIGFSTNAETNANTFATYGARGSIVRGDLNGRTIFETVDTASATGQTPIERMRIGPADTVVNDSGQNYDFRVESSSHTHALFVDGSAGTVNINYGTGTKPASAAGTQLQIGQNNNASQIFHDGTTANKGFISGTVNDDYVLYEGAASGVWNDRLRITNGGELVINEPGNDRDFRVESNSNTYALFVNGAGTCNVGIGRLPVSTVGLDLQGADSGTFTGFRLRNSSTSANAEIKQVWSLNRSGSDVDFEAGSITVGKAQEWTTTPSTVDAFMTFKTTINESASDRLRITNYGATHAVNGHLGNAYTTLNDPDRCYWTISTFNDNDTTTSGYVSVYTSNVEWQPSLIRVTASSVDNDLTDSGSAVWYVRVNGYHGAGGSIGVVDSWTSGNMSISVTATDINEHHMRVNITVTGSGNRTVGSAEALSYGGVFDTARTG